MVIVTQVFIFKYKHNNNNNNNNNNNTLDGCEAFLKRYPISQSSVLISSPQHNSIQFFIIYVPSQQL
jgi:hypothetical protein